LQPINSKKLSHSNHGVLAYPLLRLSAVSSSGAIVDAGLCLSVGRLPTLFATFFYLDMSFMVWVLLDLRGSAKIGAARI
jgi:hypothetical protein